MSQFNHSIRCDHDGLKMAEVKEGHLILRAKHHGETHVKVLALSTLYETEKRAGTTSADCGPQARVGGG